MLYAIFLRDHRVTVSIGIHPEERAAPQALLVNIALVIERRGSGDTIGEVLDYDFLRDGVRALVERGHVDLQETLCEAILAMCREAAGVMAVRVRTEKTTIFSDAAGVGCQMLWLDPTHERTELLALMTV